MRSKSINTRCPCEPTPMKATVSLSPGLTARKAVAHRGASIPPVEAAAAYTKSRRLKFGISLSMGQSSWVRCGLMAYRAPQAAELASIYRHGPDRKTLQTITCCAMTEAEEIDFGWSGSKPERATASPDVGFCSRRFLWFL